MHPHQTLLTRFYDALGRGAAEEVAACYHPDAHFSDPVFTDLTGDEVPDMWRMLLARGGDMRVESRDVTADDERGTAHWDAYYTFTTTGKPVHNSIDSAFTFRDGLIADQRDTFDFARWAGQALGVPGRLLGRTGYLRRKVRGTAAHGLRTYRRAESAPEGT